MKLTFSLIKSSEKHSKNLSEGDSISIDEKISSIMITLVVGNNCNTNLYKKSITNENITVRYTGNNNFLNT